MTKMGRPPATIDIDEVMTIADAGIGIKKAAKIMRHGKNTLIKHMRSEGRYGEFLWRGRAARMEDVSPRLPGEIVYEDASAIIQEVVGTFSSARVTVDDVRFAASVDGYDLSSVSSQYIAAIIKQGCRV